MAAGTSITLVIPSEIRLVDLVHEASQKMAELGGFDPGEALNMGLAVREAVINAIEHGNRKDPSRDVRVQFEVREGEEIRATIRDRGNGFDPRGTPDPTEGNNILKPSGRGLLMIRAFVDEVSFRYRKGRGMDVTLVKKIHPQKTEGGPAGG
jgi:serine/threonine-protein kinase RsbW